MRKIIPEQDAFELGNKSSSLIKKQVALFPNITLKTGTSELKMFLIILLDYEILAQTIQIITEQMVMKKLKSRQRKELKKLKKVAHQKQVKAIFYKTS